LIFVYPSVLLLSTITSSLRTTTAAANATLLRALPELLCSHLTGPVTQVVHYDLMNKHEVAKKEYDVLCEKYAQ
jgi:hypothetical protein